MIEFRWLVAVMIQGLVQVSFVAAPVSLMLPLLFGLTHASLYGLAVSADAVGALAGSLIGIGLHTKKPGLYALLALVAQMPQLVVIADHRSVLWLIPCGFVTGLGLSVFGVAWTTAIQVTTPRDMLGRVFTLDALSNSALMPLGLVLAGYLVPRFGVSVVAWTSAVIRAASIIIVLPVPGVSAFGQDPV